MKPPTVLIADDEAQIRTALRRRLTASGYQVVESSDGIGVLNQCPEGWVDLIIMDHSMPNGDGRSVARVIRNQTDIPIVFLSGCDREEFRGIVSELPDVYYLQKPLDAAKLTELMEALIEQPVAAMS